MQVVSPILFQAILNYAFYLPVRKHITPGRLNLHQRGMAVSACSEVTSLPKANPRMASTGCVSAPEPALPGIRLAPDRMLSGVGTFLTV